MAAPQKSTQAPQPSKARRSPRPRLGAFKAASRARGARQQPCTSSKAPPPAARIVGQEAAISAIADLLIRQRLVTLVGMGGIGKTTLAAAALAALRDRGALRWQDVRFIDLAGLADPALVAATMASALGLGARVCDTAQNLLAYLHDKPLLLLLDNCEHLLDALAPLVEQLLRGAPALRVLATSREPLRLEGEWVQRVRPLELPPQDEGLNARQARGYASVELLVQCCAALHHGFVLGDEDARAAASICRRLDGIPLALELAAARLGSRSLRDLARALDQALEQASEQGPAPALQPSAGRSPRLRHQTLAATLDWSFDLLCGVEQSVLMQLSVFRSDFSMDLAMEVATAEGIGPATVLDAIAGLVAKSLLVADHAGSEVRFRLLDTTRRYAQARLAALSALGALGSVHRRHAAAQLALLRRALQDWSRMSTPAWLARLRPALSDVRAALGWSLGEHGDVELGVALAIQATPLMFLLALTEEHLSYVEQALAALARDPACRARRPRLEAELNIVAGHVVFHARGMHPARDAAFARAAALAAALGDPLLEIMVCATLWMGSYQAADPLGMHVHAKRYADLVADSDDPELRLHRDRIMAPTLHLLGRQRAALRVAERALAHDAITRAPFLTGSHNNRGASLGFIRARALWLLGRTREAEGAIGTALDCGARNEEPVALANALAYSACPMAIWAGRHALARERIAKLQRISKEHALPAWQAFAQAFGAFVDWCEGGRGPAPPSLPRETLAVPTLVQMMSTLHVDYLSLEVLEQQAAGRSDWCRADHLRSQGEVLLACDPAGGLALLVRAMELALRQDTLFWAVRIAASMTRSGLRDATCEALLQRLAARLARLPEPPGIPELALAQVSLRASPAVRALPPTRS